jgi:hypothetical protein
MVYAPWATSVGTRVPYVTPTECTYSAILSGYDLDNLVEAGTAIVQRHALTDLIAMMSEKVDDFCLEQFGSLVATQNTENVRLTPSRDGSFIVSPDFAPILQVVSFAYSSIVGNPLINVPLSAQNCWIERYQFIVSQSGLTVSSQGPIALSLLAGFGPGRSKQFCEYAYVNGWQHSFLTVDEPVGSTSLSLSSLLGVVPGGQTKVFDGMKSEWATVSPTWNLANPVTLTAPTKYAHAAGTNASALPSTVKDAVFHFIAEELQERGQAGVTLSTTGAFTETAQSGKTIIDHASEAYDLLETFRKAWGRN